MRKTIKNLLVLSTAAVLTLGVVGLTACEKKFTPLDGDYTSQSAAVSNGGFVVEYGNYVYFINGAESYEEDNTYTVPVKGALMRIKKSDLAARENKAEIVIPSLIVSADTGAGIYIYQNRVYYATPNNTKSMSGVVEKGYLDFKSAKLDGSDIQSYFRVEDNSTVYRYVEAGESKTVYLVYYSDSTLHSYNTASNTDTTLAKNVSAYVLDSSQKSDASAQVSPVIYYTMAVSDAIDTESPQSKQYNQIYRVTADTTAAPEGYNYTWDEAYLKEHDNEEPYYNLGTLILDGVNTPTRDEDITRFTHDYVKNTSEPLTPNGYTYTLQTYANGGIYFTRKENNNIEISTLYYLSDATATAAGWNSVTGNLDKATDSTNGKLEIVARSHDVSNASASALYYIKDGVHNYIYVDGAYIYRATVDSNGDIVGKKPQPICSDASGAELISIDNTAFNTQTGEGYGYIWFTRSSGSGYSVERAVYTGNLTGSGHDYDDLPFGDNADTIAAYKSVKILDLQHKGSWYKYEVLSDLGMLFIADAESLGSSYDYVACVSIRNSDGSYMTNPELKAVNEKYDAVKSTDNTVGYIAKIQKDQANLANAFNYYFMTGKTDRFDANIAEAEALGKTKTFLYTQDEQDAFKAFANGTATDIADIKDYRVRSYFITQLGTVKEADQEAMDEYWEEYLQHFHEEEKVKEKLAPWKWALIGISIGIVVIGAGVGVYLYLVHRKKKADNKSKRPERMKVDTTDDKDVDVYAEASPEANAESEEENTSEESEESGAAEEETQE